MLHRKLLGFAMENFGAKLLSHTGIFLLSVLLVFLSASMIFLTSSLQHTITEALEAQPDFVVQKIVGDRPIPLSSRLVDEIIEIAGTSKVTQRVYGRYFFEGFEHSVLVMGVDFLDEQSHRELEKIIEKTDLNRFLSDPHAMITGESVRRWMRENDYGSMLPFVSPKGKRMTLKYDGSFPENTALFSSDMVLTQLKNAKKIFGLKRNEVTDITFDAPNEIEWEIIKVKVASLEDGLRIIDKKESRKVYEEMFNFGGGIFLMLLIMVTAAFGMILYQRYSEAYTTQMRLIGILRASGWSIGHVLEVKFFETMMIIFISYTVGVSLAYLYVFAAGAPGMERLFLGSWNFQTDLTLVPYIDLFLLVSIFLLYALPFLAVVLFPVWRVASVDPVEAMR
jgi:ABC-type lipoprotein release transport system permease subunit